MPEPRVGRWAYALPTWLGDCLNGCEWNPSVPECPNCGTIRPALPETPAPSADATRVCICGHTAAQHIYHIGGCRPGFACPSGCEKFTPPSPRFLTDAQVLGKEPIAGVDDAPVVETGVSEAEPEVIERAAQEVYERDADVGTWPWAALPVLARANLMQYVRAGAALRAAPAVGGEPVAWGIKCIDTAPPIYEVMVGDYCYFTFDSEATARAYHRNIQHHEKFTVIPLYAHPAPVANIRTALLRFIDTAGNKRDMVTPDQTGALLDLLNELHPEAPTDGK